MATVYKLLILLCLLVHCYATGTFTALVTAGGNDTMANATTAGPTGNTTATEPGGTTSPSTSVTQNGTSPTSAVATTSAGATTPSDPCIGHLCGSGSTCVPGNKTYTCICLAGQIFNPTVRICENAKVFPGQLGLADIKYKEGMEDPKSPAFKEAAKKIVQKVAEGFKSNKDYLDSTVQKIEPLNAKSLTQKSGGITATVDIIFKSTSEITTNEVSKVVTDTVGATFTETNLCDRDVLCDELTSQCTTSNGVVTCKCLDGYIKSSFSERVCSACPSGTKAEDSKCESCPFGFSGMNCNESWKLALVITACVLGALLLVAIVILPIMAMKSSKSSKKSKEDKFGNPQMSQTTKAPLVNSGLASRPAVNNAAAGGANGWMPRIPRAAPTSNWDRSTNLEMTPSNSHQNLIPGGKSSRLYEDMDNTSGSPYAQSRPQYNPYAQSRGQTNPYYTRDEDRLN